MTSSEANLRLLAHPRFELVPIKGAQSAMQHLPPAATVTVTCSPSKGIDATLEFAALLRTEGFTVVPHLSARLVTGAPHCREIVRRLGDLDVRDVFVIGGDVARPAGPYASAVEFVRALRDNGYAGDVGVAAYPEDHPLISDAELRRALELKQPLASYMVSQICFDADSIMTWLAGLRVRGIRLPLWVGFPGVVDRNKLLRVALRIGVGDSSRYLTKHGSLVSRLIRPGGYSPDELVASLAPHVGEPRLGIVGYHINTFNQVVATEKWRRRSLASKGPMGSAAARE